MNFQFMLFQLTTLLPARNFKLRVENNVEVFKKNLFIWLCWVFVAARRTFVGACEIFNCNLGTLSYGMRDLVPSPRIEPGPPALGAQSLSHWPTREVP